MKLSIVIPALNGFELTEACYNTIVDNLSQPEEVEVIILDNGSSVPQHFPTKWANTKFIRNEKSTGVYPTYKQGMEVTTGDVVAFFHNDMAVWEKNWDLKVMKRFEVNSKLGLAGFLGSWQMESHGGRGMGTASNFMGKSLSFIDKSWNGTAASVHGRKITEHEKAIQVDGCVMIFRREAYNHIEYKENFPPHHFYDRLLSAQIGRAGYEIETIGVECDHFSGQTVNSDRAYLFGIAKDWCMKHLGMPDTMENIYEPAIYKESERQFIKEFRDEKHYMPRNA